jgi:hypothetical protein
MTGHANRPLVGPPHHATVNPNAACTAAACRCEITTSNATAGKGERHGAGTVAPATVAPRPKQRYGRSMSALLATAVNNTNRNNLRANNRARPTRDCDQG